MDYTNIIEKALIAKRNTYSPYSNFAVGAALLVDTGEVFLGTNVENASFGGTICAERSAILSAISNGYKKRNFKVLAIVSDMNDYTYPCCICRQTMLEFFDENVEVLMVNKNKEYKKVTVSDLVPYAFTKKELQDV